MTILYQLADAGIERMAIVSLQAVIIVDAPTSLHSDVVIFETFGRPSNLRRTQKAKFQQSVPAMSSEDDIKEELQEIFEDANDDANNDTISTATTLHRQRSVHSPGKTRNQKCVLGLFFNFHLVRFSD